MSANEPYREAHARFVEVLDEVDAASQVPACPAWTVHDLLAHQAHQLAGACDGTFPVRDAVDALVAADPGHRRAALVRQEQWIGEGVARLRACSVSQLIEAWTEALDAAPSGALAGLFPDVAVHLFDLLGVANRASHRDHPLVLEALRFWAGQSEARFRLVGYEGLRVELDGGAAIGNPDAQVVVAGDAFTLLRAITGRRSRDQALGLVASRAAREAIDHLTVYGWRDTALDE